MRKWLIRPMKLIVLVLVAQLYGSTFAHSQMLNDSCTVSILNRSARVQSDGTWYIPNIPASFGSLRARATCTQNGLTTSGESELFTVQNNQVVGILPFGIGTSSPIPSSVTVSL